jgi:hypothetical protein
MKFRGGEFSTGTTGNFQSELTLRLERLNANPASLLKSSGIHSVLWTKGLWLLVTVRCNIRGIFGRCEEIKWTSSLKASFPLTRV